MNRFSLFILVIIANIFDVFAQKEKLFIQGSVVDENKMPMIGVFVFNTKDNVTTTDVDGRFQLNVDVNSVLTFSFTGYESKDYYVRGDEMLIDVQLLPSDIVLPEIIVSSEMEKIAKFVFSPTEMELVRNQVYVNTNYKIPNKLFFKDSRIIMMPYLVNYTNKTRKAYTPIVFDAKNYDILLKRGNICGDAKEVRYFSQFAQVVDEIDSNKKFYYKDSCEIQSLNDKYATEVYIKVTTFCQKDYLDTIVVAQGVVFPMRKFVYDGVSYDLDERYAPQQEIFTFNEKGELNLSFRPERHEIYEQDGNNRQELSKLRKILKELDVDESKTLTDLSVIGYTSPDGSLKRNQSLSKKRVQSAFEAITQVLSRKTLEQAEVHVENIVVPWDSVYKAMERDSLPEAEELLNAIQRTRGNHDDISWLYRRMKGNDIISKKYLPRFRKVEYFYRYNERRTLTDDEINNLYKKDKSQLTASEYWRYVCLKKDDSVAQRIQLLKEALHYHPDLMIAANNLAALLNRTHQADTTILKPFITPSCPEEVLINQMIAYFQCRNFDAANKMKSLLPVSGKTSEVEAMVAALNGYYEKAYEYYKDKDCLNKAILLLCLKRNKEAYEFVRNLDETSADADYVRAIAANRNNDISAAIDYLKRAIRTNPEIRKTAEVDGDLLDLLEFID